MCCGNQRLAECVQTSAERGEDTAVMARLESACGQGRLPQPATPAPTSSPVVVRECHQDARPGVHLVSRELLQLTAVRHQ